MKIVTLKTEGLHFVKINDTIYHGTAGALGYRFKQEICKMLGTNDDNGMVGHWKVEESGKVFNDYYTLLELLNKHRKEMCRILKLRDDSDFSTIIQEMRCKYGK